MDNNKFKEEIPVKNNICNLCNCTLTQNVNSQSIDLHILVGARFKRSVYRPIYDPLSPAPENNKGEHTIFTSIGKECIDVIYCDNCAKLMENIVKKEYRTTVLISIGLFLISLGTATFTILAATDIIDITGFFMFLLNLIIFPLVSIFSLVYGIIVFGNRHLSKITDNIEKSDYFKSIIILLAKKIDLSKTPFQFNSDRKLSKYRNLLFKTDYYSSFGSELEAITYYRGHYWYKITTESDNAPSLEGIDMEGEKSYFQEYISNYPEWLKEEKTGIYFFSDKYNFL